MRFFLIRSMRSFCFTVHLERRPWFDVNTTHPAFFYMPMAPSLDPPIQTLRRSNSILYIIVVTMRCPKYRICPLTDLSYAKTNASYGHRSPHELCGIVLDYRMANTAGTIFKLVAKNIMLRN